MDRRVRFERTLEVETFGDLADRREDLLAYELDAGERVFLAHLPVIAPQRQDARPRLFEDALQLGDDRLGRAGDDAEVRHLLLEAGVAARIDGAAGGELAEGATGGRRAVARRRAPPRVGNAGELPPHPAERLGIPDPLALLFR